MIFFEMLLTIFLAIIFLFLISIVLSVIRFEPCLFLCINHKIISKFMIEMMKIEMREIIFRWFLRQMIKWIFFRIILSMGSIFLSNFFILKSIFRLFEYFIFGQFVLLLIMGNLFINDGVDIIGFFLRLNRSPFLLLIIVYWIFHSVSTTI